MTRPEETDPYSVCYKLLNMKSSFHVSGYRSNTLNTYQIYTWTSIRQGFFANNSGNAVWPNLFYCQSFLLYGTSVLNEAVVANPTAQKAI